MKLVKIKKDKIYHLRKKGSRSVGNIELTNISVKSSEVSYWYFDGIEENKDSEGTPYHIYAIIPRMAGFDDHGGERINKTVIVSYGKYLRLHPDLAINPQTGECLLGEDYVLE